jgi:hypothetical protein
MMATPRGLMMHVAEGELRLVAKKKAGRPKGTNNRGEGKLVRIDPEIYNKSRVIAIRSGIKLGDYLSGLLEDRVERDYMLVLGELNAEKAKKDSEKNR